MPGVRGIAECGKGFKGNKPAEAAHKSRLGSDGAAILINGAGTGDQFAKCLAFEDRLDDAHKEPP